MLIVKHTTTYFQPDRGSHYRTRSKIHFVKKKKEHAFHFGVSPTCCSNESRSLFVSWGCQTHPLISTNVKRKWGKSKKGVLTLVKKGSRSAECEGGRKDWIIVGFSYYTNVGAFDSPWKLRPYEHAIPLHKDRSFLRYGNKASSKVLKNNFLPNYFLNNKICNADEMHPHMNIFSIEEQKN